MLRPTPQSKQKGRKGAVRKVSSKRAVQLREYAKARRAYLVEWPFCEIALCGGSASVEIHHRAGRIGDKLLDEKDWLATCRNCHDWCHHNPSMARKMNLLK